jgi:G3E family GTPase
MFSEPLGTKSASIGQVSHNPQRFILLGGFLGAGKTTIVERLADWLKGRKLIPGIVSNDQADGLIDTAIGRQHSRTAVAEVTGGCFCCRAGELGKALERLTVESRPDVFIAEPVGSCTDLMATVVLPIQQIYAVPLMLAPMSVLIDAARLAAAVLPDGRTTGARRGFSADVQYIFDKQLEEAEILVLNKVDLVSKPKLKVLRSWLEQSYPGKPIHGVSTVTGEGLEAWFECLLTEQSGPATLMEVDYERYGVGEARMGWFNATLGLHATSNPLDANAVLLELAAAIQQDLEADGVELAHFKMSLSSKNGEMAVVNAVRNGERAALSRRSTEKVMVAELLINLRAEAEPELLDRWVSAHVDRQHKKWRAVWKQRAFFKPGQPQPTYRVTVLEGRA